MCVQELLASLPQPSDQDWDLTVERGAQLDVTPNHDFQADGTSGTHLPQVHADEELLIVGVNKSDTTAEASEPSASEEQLQEAAKEQK